jgi:hypothetical protein
MNAPHRIQLGIQSMTREFSYHWISDIRGLLSGEGTQISGAAVHVQRLEWRRGFVREGDPLVGEVVDGAGGDDQPRRKDRASSTSKGLAIPARFSDNPRELLGEVVTRHG